MSPSPQHDPETSSNRGSEQPTRTALVLGGGGSAGNAWLIGVLAGLCDAGLDVTDADLVVGTSAGATAAAQVSGARPAELLAAVLDAHHGPGTRPAPSERAPAPIRSVTNVLEATGAIIAAAQDAADMRRRMGAWALGTDTASSSDAQARWRATVAARLPGELWPQRSLLITAVDARTGEPVVFDRDGGVDLVDAVAASCAGGFAYAIGSGAYLDGGYRTNADNADLAAGYERVLVLSPLGGRSRTPVGWGLHLATQVDDLRAHGSRVATVFPDAASLAAFGDNLMDPSTRPPAARAGYEQGTSLVDLVSELWLPCGNR